MNIYNSIDTRIVSSLQAISICENSLHKYLSLVNRYLENPPKENYEKHHILPKSLFPEYKNLRSNKWNCVKLPQSSHIEAHALLVDFTNDSKMILAYNFMINAGLYYKNYISVKDKFGNYFYVSKDHPSYINGEYVGITKGLMVAVDSNGKHHQIKTDDIRLQNGEFKSLIKEKVCVKNEIDEYMFVSIDDSRYISGELIPSNKNKTVVKDKDGNKFSVDINDPRFISGELVGHTSGMIPSIDKDGNKFYVSNNDPRYKSGELFHHSKGMVKVKDKDGNKFYVKNTNEKFLSGEYVGINKGHKIYNNGVISKKFHPSEVPDGWNLGKLQK